MKIFVVTKVDSEGKLESIQAFGPQEEFAALQAYVAFVKAFFHRYAQTIDFINVPFIRIQANYFDAWLRAGKPDGLAELRILHVSPTLEVEPASPVDSFNFMHEPDIDPDV